MKKFIQLIPLSIFTIFALSCNDYVPAKNEEKAKEIANFSKEIKEILYVDNGAVVPNPTIRRVSFLLKDSLNAIMSYVEYMKKDTIRSNISITDADRLEILRDNLTKLGDTDDGVEFMPGKEPCVGVKGVDVALIYNSGDTARFKISSGARCDRAVIPEWKMLDSLAIVLFQEFRAAK